MIHEFNCIRCGKRDWHYADDCQGEHPRHCSECESYLTEIDALGMHVAPESETDQ